MKPKFLVVEDHADCRTLLETMLQSFGCETVGVEDGEQALKVIESPNFTEEFDAVFLDIMLPKINGYTVLSRVKSHPKTSETPVIMLTAKDRDQEMIDGYQQGADYYITKPFTMEQLIYGLDLVFGDGDLPIKNPAKAESENS